MAIDKMSPLVYVSWLTERSFRSDAPSTRTSKLERPRWTNDEAIKALVRPKPVALRCVAQKPARMSAASSSAPVGPHLPFVIYVLTAGTFLMGSTEFVVAGLLPEVARDFQTTVARSGLAITVFAVAMV